MPRDPDELPGLLLAAHAAVYERARLLPPSRLRTTLIEAFEAVVKSVGPLERGGMVYSIRPASGLVRTPVLVKSQANNRPPSLRGRKGRRGLIGPVPCHGYKGFKA